MGSKQLSRGLVVVMIISLLKGGDAAGAGRAFPIDSENYAISNFQRINPRIEWDPTNFLVDLSGQYSNCYSIPKRDFLKVDRLTQEGYTIGGYVDYADGLYSDVNSINEYLMRVIDRWIQQRTLHGQIRVADRFGCSVRPGCSGRVSISCLFSPAGGSDKIPPPPPPPASPAPPCPTCPPCEQKDPPKPPKPNPEPRALAFTPEQYKIAEDIFGYTWDRSHFLENLSGSETDCEMIENPFWRFAKAEVFAKDVGLIIRGIYNNEPNYGSTPVALEKILSKTDFNKPEVVRNAKRVGCSIIPDCMLRRQMYVVVSCLFEI